MKRQTCRASHRYGRGSRDCKLKRFAMQVSIRMVRLHAAIVTDRSVQYNVAGRNPLPMVFSPAMQHASLSSFDTPCTVREQRATRISSRSRPADHGTGGSTIPALGIGDACLGPNRSSGQPVPAIDPDCDAASGEHRRAGAHPARHLRTRRLLSRLPRRRSPPHARHEPRRLAVALS